jgi:hypothetical protein
MSKLYKFLVIAIILTGVLAGCKGKVEETYVLTSLKNAASGDVVSIGFKYSFDSPNVIGAANNVALVREGNRIEFFIGDGLEAKLKGVEGKQFAVAARKYFTPYIHFVVDYLWAGSDTIQVGEPAGVKLPLLRPEAQFTAPEEYITVELNKLTSSALTLKEIAEKKFKVENAKIAAEQLPGGNGDESKLVLRLKNVGFTIDETNDAMLAVLKAIMTENKPFNGGVIYGAVPRSDRAMREKYDLGGDVKIGYILYGGNAIMIQM